VIAYLDTSALVKLYVEEEGSSLVHRAVKEAEASVTSVVAYPEARAALARARRERVLAPADYRASVDALDADWGSLSLVQGAESLARRAGLLAEKHALRGFDAIHLASGLASVGGVEGAVFLCFDGRLARGARREGLKVLGMK
jgi:predicted nucleic acid-binding protein